MVDSDDYLDENALRRALDTLALAVEAERAPDLLITNYVYDHLGNNSQRVMQYRSFFPAGRLITWDDMRFSGEKIYQDKFIMIHAAWYKTSILRESGVRLPEGVSYMDSMLLLHPMPLVKTLFYLDVAPYHYLIGREGQSVEIDVVKRGCKEAYRRTAARFAACHRRLRLREALRGRAGLCLVDDRLCVVHDERVNHPPVQNRNT